MPRTARLFLPGMPLHVVQRGVNRQACFRDVHDKHRYLDYLCACLTGAPCDLHAYVLMNNHVHFLLSTQEVAHLSLLMKTLNQRYTQYFNWRHGRSGSLWEGRYKSCLVQGDRYLLTCQRYIELNPVRADIVDFPGQYRWSSYRGNAQGMQDDLLTPHPLYLSLGVTVPERQKTYQSLFQEKLTEQSVGQLRAAINAEFAVGDQVFLRRVAEASR